MQYKYAFFGDTADSETKALSFIDNNWDRVVSFGHTDSLDQMEAFEKPGWYVRFSKNAVAAATVKTPRKTTTN